MRKAYIFRHESTDNVGTVRTVLRQRGFELVEVLSFCQDVPQDAATADLLVVMGGVFGMYQADDYPYLHDEIRTVEKRLAADLPTLGICLGGQMMALAAGGRVYKGAKGSELGWHHIRLTAAGETSPVAQFAPEKTAVLQLHGDTFDLPPGAVLLAESDLYPQAFAIGRSIGVQFHPEIDARAAEEYAICLSGAFASGALDIRAYREGVARYLTGLERQNAAFMTQWMGREGL